MEVVRLSSSHLMNNRPRTTIEKSHLRKPIWVNFPRNPARRKTDYYKLCTAISRGSSTEPSSPPLTELETDLTGEERFDWFAQWYPIMPVCDLDKRIPHAKKVMGIDVVVWWDRNENDWKVFDDLCPHRLAPLSEGRIDQWGRLQCVYHGWCFNGSGDCKFIPQAPPDGPPVHTFKKACVSVYPSIVQNNIVWFWPNTNPEYKDIHLTKKPPYIAELDDPLYTKLMGNRDFPYGYEFLIENLMDPAHVPYAHFRIMKIPPSKNIKADREGGEPIEITVKNLSINGFDGEQPGSDSKFIPPCVFYTSFTIKTDVKKTARKGNGSALSSGKNMESSDNVVQKKALLIFICIPVSPGKSRLIWSFPRNFGQWIDRVIPRWIFHLSQNLILDSDLYLLHLEEKKIVDLGVTNWQKVCYVPTKSDGKVAAFRRWLNKYSSGEVGWRDKFRFSPLPPSPPREQLMDRYWSHIVNCKSCNSAHKALKLLEIALQVVSVASLGLLAAFNGKQGWASPAGGARVAVVTLALLCFGASRWLSHFIYKNFHFHDYDHSLV